MHYTGVVYRNPYQPPSPLLEITQGCSHNRCKFCTMYKGVRFRPSPLDDIKEDVLEIASVHPNAKRLQILSADPFSLTFKQLKERIGIINTYLPSASYLTMPARISSLKRKSVEELKELHEMGVAELELGVESGDEWTLARITKGYHAEEIVPLAKKLDAAGIKYWLTYLNGVAGRSHSREHAIHTAETFNQLNPVVVGTGGLTLFPGTPLLEEAKRGEFDPLNEREMLEELKLFLETLDVDCTFITHHTIATNLSGGNFLNNKKEILRALQHELDHMDEERLSLRRKRKRTL